LRTSTRSAQQLLSAWESADWPSLRIAADQAETAEPGSFLEGECIEMVREAGKVLRRCAVGAGEEADADASVQVLRHLASHRR
jgi:hypothetical protein